MICQHCQRRLDHGDARCEACGEWRPGTENAVQVDVKLTILRDHGAPYRAAAIMQLPPAAWLMSEEAALDAPLATTTIQYDRRKIDTPAGPRWLYWRAEDTWLLSELLQIASGQLQQIAENELASFGNWARTEIERGEAVRIGSKPPNVGLTLALLLERWRVSRRIAARFDSPRDDGQ
jgi:hypothetical protein